MVVSIDKAIGVGICICIGIGLHVGICIGIGLVNINFVITAIGVYVALRLASHFSFNGMPLKNSNCFGASIEHQRVLNHRESMPPACMRL